MYLGVTPANDRKVLRICVEGSTRDANQYRITPAVPKSHSEWVGTREEANWNS